MKIKICGLTRTKEAEYLNINQADYAGFVFFEKSKRYVTIAKAKEIMTLLDSKISKVAVTVSPSKELARELMDAGFDILQVHKELSPEVIDAVQIPIWYAINVESEESIKETEIFLDKLSDTQRQKITGIVVDGAAWGSGKPFDWSMFHRIDFAKDRAFILAGGLNCENVQEGINLFSPDIVDVSSSVEDENGKSLDKIYAFVKAVYAKAKDKE